MKRWQIERSMDNAIKRLAANAGATEVEIARQLLSDALERREKAQEDAQQNL